MAGRNGGSCQSIVAANEGGMEWLWVNENIEVSERHAGEATRPVYHTSFLVLTLLQCDYNT